MLKIIINYGFYNSFLLTVRLKFALEGYLLELHVSFCSQDDTAQLFLGNCYESGFVVQQNLRTAITFYKQAARAGNKQAERLLRPPNETYSKDAKNVH